MDPKHHKHVVSAGREVVRVNRLEYTLQKFRLEVAEATAEGMAESMAQFHEKYLSPEINRLEERIEWLEKPLYAKWWWRLKSWTRFLLAAGKGLAGRVRIIKQEPEVEETVEDSEPAHHIVPPDDERRAEEPEPE